ncbi:MAG: flagellin [bacterium]|jgi:flagellin
MSLRINQNISAINSHRNLLSNDKALSKSLERLSSGLKINRAADGPAALVISEQMRSQVAGLNQAVVNSEAAISMVQTTEGALSEVNTLLTSLRGLAIHAANEGANDQVMLEADQQEVENALASISRISTFTQFGTKKLLDGSNGANGRAVGESVQFVSASTNTKASSDEGYEIRIKQNATQASAVGTTALTQEMVTAGETLTVIEGGKSVTYTTTKEDSLETAIQNLQSALKENGLRAEAELSSDGLIQVSHTEYGSKFGLQVASSTAGVLSTAEGDLQTAAEGMDVAGTINGESAKGEGRMLTGNRGTSVDGLNVRLKDSVDVGSDSDLGVVAGRVQVSQNSLNFQVGANRDQTVGISLTNTSASSLSNGVETVSEFSSLAEIDVRTSQGAQDSLALIDTAINEISISRAELGAFQKNSLESNLSNLRITSENLTAAESSIRDADMAAEMASFTRNQIMMKSSTAMLAQANQVPNNVLSLL